MYMLLVVVSNIHMKINLVGISLIVYLIKIKKIVTYMKLETT